MELEIAILDRDLPRVHLTAGMEVRILANRGNDHYEIYYYDSIQCLPVQVIVLGKWLRKKAPHV